MKAYTQMYNQSYFLAVELHDGGCSATAAQPDPAGHQVHHCRGDGGKHRPPVGARGASLAESAATAAVLQWQTTVGAASHQIPGGGQQYYWPTCQGRVGDTNFTEYMCPWL